MSNLTRYDCELEENVDWGHSAVMVKSSTGEYVKFDDIKEFLKPAHNKQGTPCKERCGNYDNNHCDVESTDHFGCFVD